MNCNFTCYFVRTLILISRIKGRKYTKYFWEENDKGIKDVKDSVTYGSKGEETIWGV